MFKHLAQFPEIVHFISTRKGGVSVAPYDSLNVSFSVGDLPENVLANREIVAQKAGIALENCIIPQLSHGTNIEVVNETHRGKGIFSPSTAFKATDAFITNIPETCLWVTSADCTPIFFYDPIQKVIGLAHAGWKGTLSEIAVKTAEKMHTLYGCNFEDMQVGIGVSIGECCYEVSQALAEQFSQAFGTSIISRPETNRFHLNLWEANRIQLARIGILPQHIEVTNICTSCNNGEYYSYRKENGTTGRFCAGIYLKQT